MQIFKHLTLIVCSLLIVVNLAYSANNNPHIFNYTMVDVKIQKQIFVYTVAIGDITQDFEIPLKRVTNYLESQGIKHTKRIIFYLDANIESGFNDTTNNFTNNKRSLADLQLKYGKRTVNLKRRALVGYFISPFTPVGNTENIHVLYVENTWVKAFQTIESPQKKLIKPVAPGSEEQKQREEKDYYENLDRFYDRISMLKYISSLSINKNKYVGVMEMYDSEMSTYTMIAFPGNKSKFIEDNKLLPLFDNLIDELRAKNKKKG